MGNTMSSDSIQEMLTKRKLEEKLHAKLLAKRIKERDAQLQKVDNLKRDIKLNKVPPSMHNQCPLDVVKGQLNELDLESEDFDDLFSKVKDKMTPIMKSMKFFT